MKAIRHGAIAQPKRSMPKHGISEAFTCFVYSSVFLSIRKPQPWDTVHSSAIKVSLGSVALIANESNLLKESRNPTDHVQISLSFKLLRATFRGVTKCCTVQQCPVPRFFRVFQSHRTPHGTANVCSKNTLYFEMKHTPFPGDFSLWDRFDSFPWKLFDFRLTVFALSIVRKSSFREP